MGRFFPIERLRNSTNLVNFSARKLEIHAAVGQFLKTIVNYR